MERPYNEGPREDQQIHAMRDELKYQLRLTIRDPFADAAHNHQDDPSIAPLTQVLQRHDAVLKCQHDGARALVAD